MAPATAMLGDRYRPRRSRAHDQRRLQRHRVSLDGFLIPPGSAGEEIDGGRTPLPSPATACPRPKSSSSAGTRPLRHAGPRTGQWPQQTVIALLHSESPAERDARLLQHRKPRPGCWRLQRAQHHACAARQRQHADLGLPRRRPDRRMAAAARGAGAARGRPAAFGPGTHPRRWRWCMPGAIRMAPCACTTVAVTPAFLRESRKSRFRNGFLSAASRCRRLPAPTASR